MPGIMSEGSAADFCSPGMQDAEEADLRAEMLGVRGNLSNVSAPGSGTVGRRSLVCSAGPAGAS